MYKPRAFLLIRRKFAKPSSRISLIWIQVNLYTAVYLRDDVYPTRDNWNFARPKYSNQMKSSSIWNRCMGIYEMVFVLYLKVKTLRTGSTPRNQIQFHLATLCIYVVMFVLYVTVEILQKRHTPPIHLEPSSGRCDIPTCIAGGGALSSCGFEYMFFLCFLKLEHIYSLRMSVLHIFNSMPHKKNA